MRASFGENESSSRPLRWAVYALILFAIFGFTWWLIRDWKETLYFMGGIAAAFFILWGIARLLTFLLRRFFPKKWSYVLRQGIANLFRPENQTVLLVVTIGLGTMLGKNPRAAQAPLFTSLLFAGLLVVCGPLAAPAHAHPGALTRGAASTSMSVPGKPRPPRIVIVGGGLAGLAAASALADRDLRITLLESRPRLGGRASSFTDPITGELVDNCQHVSMACCTKKSFASSSRPSAGTKSPADNNTMSPGTTLQTSIFTGFPSRNSMA